MDARRPGQFNVRSDFLRQRVPEVVIETGLTAAQVMEEALRSRFPVREGERFGRLIRKGRFWVFDSHDGSPTTLEQINASIQADRNGERD